MSNTVRFEEDTACDQCGRFGVYVFASERLCLECYETRGSCCAEFHPTCSATTGESDASQPPATHDERQPRR